MEQDTMSDTAPTRIALNQAGCRSHQRRHRCNSREGREVDNWGRQPRARGLAFVAQWVEEGMRRGAPRPLRRR
jgi:hypothetical protein